MSAPIASNLRELLNIEKKRYLEERAAAGGTAAGFRERVRASYQADQMKYVALVLDAVMESATKTWQQAPRKRGPDLFCVAGQTIPEYLTRPASFVTGDDIEHDDEEKFEKVDAKFATISDLFDDATIKMRKAAQSSAAAETEMKAADEARRRARGNMAALLREIADPPPASKDKLSDQPQV